MWEYNYAYSSNELYHHGIKGQRWGFRRFQNPDGTLTPAGKRRAAKLKLQYTELTGKQLRKNPTKKATPKPEKSVNDMTNQELIDKINRMNLERAYKQALSTANPQKVSRGRKFIETFKDKALDSIAKNSGEALGDVTKSLVKKALNKSLGLEEEKKDKKKKDKKEDDD